MPKPKTKTVTAEVVLKGKKVPDFGLGKGVISKAEITFSDPNSRGFDSSLFQVSLMEQADSLRRGAVEIRFSHRGKVIFTD